MKRTVVIAFMLVGLVFFLPWLWGEPAGAGIKNPPPEEEEQPSEPDAPPPAEPDAAAAKGERRDAAVSLTVLINGELSEMDMETYLTGVLRAEMPAVFEPEALKAQAVAARTYTIYKIQNGGSGNHPQADACDDITCCKAYKTAEAAAADWDTEAALYEEKLRNAVRDTDGECVLYEGRPILAVFHSSSAGATLDSADVWSESLPYLQSVTSPENEETVPGYLSTISFSQEELRACLTAALPEAKLEGAASNWFTNIQQEPSGTITRISVGGTAISGNQLRTILGLRSACFTMSFEGDSIAFSVKGYGHGVGMSQYGANVLAQGGMDYREILTWYYTGSSVEPYDFSR